jgi:ABC-type dipeptide/oligopeptide/nickel transport system ATPase component
VSSHRTPILSAQNLSITLDDDSASPVTLVHEVDLAVAEGECLGVVGESGSGKSLTSLAFMRLLPDGLRLSADHLTFMGQDLLTMAAREVRSIRGKDIAMVFQDPTAALNPSRTIRRQLTDVIRAHEDIGRREADARAVTALEDVGFPDARHRYNSYPFQLSGGLRQRVCIAMALVCNPKVVIADEPTTNLDVSVQAGILQLIRRRIDTDGFGCVFVSHDLGVISAVADRAVVMYAGQIVECGPTDAILSRPVHPYTRGLIAAAPTMSSSLDHPLAPYTSRRPAPSSTRPASRLEAVAGSSDHYARVQEDLR